MYGLVFIADDGGAATCALVLADNASSYGQYVITPGSVRFVRCV